MLHKTNKPTNLQTEVKLNNKLDKHNKPMDEIELINNVINP